MMPFPAINAPNLVTDNLNLGNSDPNPPQIPRNPQLPKRASFLVLHRQQCRYKDLPMLCPGDSQKRLPPLYPPIGRMTVIEYRRWTDQEIAHSKISLDNDRFLSNHLHNPWIIVRTVTIST